MEAQRALLVGCLLAMAIMDHALGTELLSETVVTVVAALIAGELDRK